MPRYTLQQTTTTTYQVNADTWEEAMDAPIPPNSRVNADQISTIIVCESCHREIGLRSIAICDTCLALHAGLPSRWRLPSRPQED